MVELSELCRIGGLQLVRDATIGSLGFLDIDLDHRLVFVSSEGFAAQANTTPGISAVLAGPELAQFDWQDSLGLALSDHPANAFVNLHNHLANHTDFYETGHDTEIDPSARIHPKAHIDERGVIVGPECRIGPYAVVLEGSTLGRRVQVMSGAVIGSTGFQTMRTSTGMIDVEHAGSVMIGDGTTVMANAVIARAVFKQPTKIGEDCRIGNAAFVSHNCRVGAHSMVGHGAVVAGNTSIGTNVVIGPGATLIDRISIGDGAKVTAGAVVTQTVGPGQRVSGNFAVEHAAFIRALKQASTS